MALFLPLPLLAAATLTAPDPFQVHTLGAGALLPDRDVQRVRAAQLSSDRLVDGVVQVDGRLEVLYGIEAYDSLHALGLDAVAFEVVEGIAAGGLDALLVADATGARLASLTADPETGIATLGTRTLPQAPPGADVVVVGDLDGDGSLDAALACATLPGVWVYPDVASRPAPAVLAAPLGVTAVAFVDVDGLAGAEVVCAVGGDLFRLGAGAPQPLATFPGVVTGLAALDGAGAKRVAVLHRDAGVDHLATLVPASGATTTLALGAVDAAGLATAPLDGDALVDVALVARAHEDVWVLYDTGAPLAPFALAAGAWQVVGMRGTNGGLPPGGAASLHGHDHDGDGDLDLVVGAVGHTGVLRLESGLVDASTLAPAYASAAVQLWYEDQASTSPYAQEYWVELILPDTSGASWTHLETLARVRPAGGAPLGAAVHGYERTPLDGSGSVTVTLPFELEMTGPGDLLYLSRLVEVDAGGLVVAAGPAFTRTFAPNARIADQNAAAAGLSAPAYVPIYETYDDGPQNLLSGSREGTGDTPIVPPPPVDDDEGPVPPGPATGS